MLSITGPPTAREWESRRPLITQLYRDEGKPLHKVMAVVNHSGFRASTKMYRTRIHQWGLDKKLKEHEARAIIHMHARRRGKATQMRFRDLPVDIEKAHSHFKRKGITIDDVLSSDAAMLPDLVCETPAASQTPMPKDVIPIISSQSTIPEPQNLMTMAGPQGLGSPRAFRAVEMLLVDAREYLLGSIHSKHGHSRPRDLSCALIHAQLLKILGSKGYSLFDQDQDFNGLITKYKAPSDTVIFVIDTSCEAILLSIELIATLLKRQRQQQQQQQQNSRAWLLCKQLHCTATISEFRRHPIISVLGRLFSTIGVLLHHDEAPDYLLAIVHVFIDSLKTILGPAHILTVSAAISLSRVTSLLYGPGGLLEPLETLRSSLEEQDGWGHEQSAMILIEMMTLEIHSGHPQAAQKLQSEIDLFAILPRIRAVNLAAWSWRLLIGATWQDPA